MAYIFNKTQIALFVEEASRVLAMKGTTVEYHLWKQEWETVTVPLINAWAHSTSNTEASATFGNMIDHLSSW